MTVEKNPRWLSKPRDIMFYNLLVTSCVLRIESTGWCAPDFGESFDESDSDQIIEMDEDWSPDDSADIESSQGERRAEANQAVFFQFGEATAWNTYGIRYEKWLQPSVSWSLFGGYGSNRQTFTSQSLEVRSRTVNLGGRLQWWPSELFPFSFSGDLGLHDWTLTTECTSVDAVGSCGAGVLKARGLTAGGGLIVSWFSEDQFVLEWLIIGFKRAFIFQQSTTTDINGNSETQAKKLIAGQKPISFVNLSLGYRF